MTLRTSAAIVFASLGLLLVSGCNVVGLVAGKAMPPPRVPAVYDLQGRTTAVRVMADESLMGEAALADLDPVAATAERTLRDQAELPVVTGGGPAERVVIIELRPTNERQVIGSDYSPGVAAARVRVEDSEGTEVWPADGSEGQYVLATLPAATAGDARSIRLEALRELGRQSARFFYPQVIED